MGRARSRERVEDTSARHTDMHDIPHELQRLLCHVDAFGRVRVPEHARQTSHRTVDGKRAVGRPQHVLALLAVPAFLRPARHLVPYHLTAPDPPGPLDRIGKARSHTPVNEHAQHSPRLAGFAHIAQPFRHPARPAPLVFLVAVKIRQRLVRAHAAVFLCGRPVFLAGLRTAAGIGRVGDHRVEHAGLKRTHDAERVPMQERPPIAAAVFHSQFCVLVHDQIQFIGFTQRHYPCIIE